MGTTGVSSQVPRFFPYKPGFLLIKVSYSQVGDLIVISIAIHAAGTVVAIPRSGNMGDRLMLLNFRLYVLLFFFFHTFSQLIS